MSFVVRSNCGILAGSATMKNHGSRSAASLHVAATDCCTTVVWNRGTFRMKASNIAETIAGATGITLPDAGGFPSRRRRLFWTGWTSFLSLVVLLLTVLGTTAIRTRLLSMPLERDEGEYALAGRLILLGHPPYERLYNMKWPGTYYSYAIIEWVFGQNIEGIRLGILFVNIAAVVLVFLIARRMLDAYAAVAAAVAYAILSLSPATLGLAGHAAHFVVLSALTAILLLQNAFTSQRLGLYLLAGFFAGLRAGHEAAGHCFHRFCSDLLGLPGVSHR